MSDLRKAAEMALEALETLDCGDTYKTHNAASALRQALPPVKTYSGGKPNYCTDPEREWVEITRGEISEIWGNSQQTIDEEKDAIAFGFAIEAKLKEKNT
jgi:hypothetical protein